MTVLDVGKCISTMANNKSTGRDNISPCLLKLALPYIVEPLTYIHNLSIKKKCFSNRSQESKGNSSSKGQRFRRTKQLSLHIHTPVTFKTDWKTCTQALTKFLNERDLLSQSQSGFRPKHSCHTALTKLFDNWLTAINNSEVVGAVFLDLKKAFDLVNYNILIKKLSLYTANSPVVAF